MATITQKRLLAALLVPAALFVAVEAALRLAGVAALPPGVEVAISEGVTRVRVDAPYSAIGTDAAFAAMKPPGAFRIAFLGASTTRGVPYAAFCSYPAMATVRLAAMFPDRSIEGINLGVPTEGVRTTRALADVALDAGADLLVVEAGHNEFLVNTLPAAEGPFPALRRWIADLRIARLLFAAKAAAGPAFDRNVRRALGESKDRLELVGDAARERRDRIERWFREDLEAIVAAARARGAGVVLLVPPVRWSGFWPERSFAPPGLAPDEVARLAELVAAADRDALRAAAPDLAIARFWSGDFEGAWENDPTPVGASPRLHHIIKEVANSGAATLADAHARFAAAADGGFIGPDLLVDHCHPTIQGQYLLASAVLDAIRATGLLVAPDAWPGAADPPLAPTLARLGVDARLAATGPLQAALADVSFALISFASVPYAERALAQFAAADEVGYGAAQDLAAARVMRGIAELLCGRRDAAVLSFEQALAADAAAGSAYLAAVLGSSARAADAFAAAGLELRGATLVTRAGG